jgi:hypothetical protein
MIKTALPSGIGALLRLVLVVFVVVLVPASPVAAQEAARSVDWQRFDVDLTVQSDGSVNVVETQAIHFTGSYQQGYRLVPLDRTTGVRAVSVDETVGGQSVPYAPGTDRPGTYSTSTNADGLRIDWWFSPTSNATRVFTLRYTLDGAIRIDAAGDQLQWRAIYADRDGSVDASTVTVHLPADVPLNAITSAWYRYPASGTIGALSPVAQGTVVDGHTVQFSIAGLQPNQGAETRVQFPHGLVPATPPAWQAAADQTDWLAQTVAPIGDFVALLLTLGLLGGGAAVLVIVWFSSGRDPRVGSAPPRLQQPPSSLPAPLAGTLVDEVASERDAVAALVDLAGRGLVHLQDEQNPELLGSGTDVRITLAAKLDDPRLRGYERALLMALFGPSPGVPAETLLSSVKPRFQASIPLIVARLYDSVAEQGLFTHNPDTTRRQWRAIGVTLLSAGIVLAVAAGLLLGKVMHIAWLPGIALALVGGGLVWLAGSMPRRTQLGALEAAKWRAFAAHLTEVSRSDKPGAALPAEYLPYAVAFGVDQTFVHHLESVGTPTPSWLAQDRGGRWGGPGGVVVLPGGWYGGGPWTGPGSHPGGPGGSPGVPGAGGIAAPSAPNPQGWSDVLAGVLKAASDAMAHGGGSGGWSGGGFGGGGGGGGGSGGFR